MTLVGFPAQSLYNAIYVEMHRDQDIDQGFAIPWDELIV